MTTLIKTDLDRPLAGCGELRDYLARGARPRAQWGIGAETEKLVIDRYSGEAAAFGRIEALLLHLEQQGNWRGLREEGRLIALFGDGDSITLEPGGQLELSGKICRDVHGCAAEFQDHMAEITGPAKALGLAFLGLGVQPFSSVTQIDWVPKTRYRVMGPYMERVGDLGQSMMKQTAGLQVNLDFCDEADCFDKLRTAQLLAPLLYALTANSPLRDGRPSGWLTTRGEIWSRTDPDRTGLLPWLWDETAGFDRYVDHALDVPMYFIVREGQFLDLTTRRFTFRRFLQEGWGSHRARLADWDLHLSTLFPEVRLRPQIEVRSADSLPPHLVPGVAAFLKGILYSPDARRHYRDMFRDWDAPALNCLLVDCRRRGLQAAMGRHTLREVALETLALARTGLHQQDCRNQDGQDESIFLEGLEEIAQSGVTPAEGLLSRWQEDSRPGQVAALLEHCAY